MSTHNERPIRRIDPKEKISCCPECKYKDGFHVSLYNPDKAKLSEVILICPSCHSHFGLGWKVDLHASASDS